MGQTTTFMIGCPVHCTDGTSGELRRVVIDPVGRLVTHLVVAPKHHWLHGLGRLVPLNLVDAVGLGEDGGIWLLCTQAEFDVLDPADETHFLPDEPTYPGYGTGQVLAWPYYGLGGLAGLGAVAEAALPRAITYEKVPLGKVAIHRGDPVHATDGEIGQIQGLVLTLDQHVTHLLLQEGHIWGRKQVAIPITAVVTFCVAHSDGIGLNLTTRQIQDLPPVEIGYPNC